MRAAEQSEEDHVDVVNVLVKYGANVDHRNNVRRL